MRHLSPVLLLSAAGLLAPLAFAKDAPTGPQEIKAKGVISNVGGDPDQLINGSGLSEEANPAARTHACMDKGGGFWNADAPPKGQPYFFDKKSKTPELVFDLGGAHKLKALMVWNYSYSAANDTAQRRSVANVIVAVSDSEKGPWKPLTQLKFRNTEYNNGRITPQILALPAAQAKYVKLLILGTQVPGPSENIGMGELHFVGTPVEDAKAPAKAKETDKAKDKKPATGK